MTGSGWRRSRRDPPAGRRRLPSSLLVGGSILGLVTAFAIAAPLFGNPLHENLVGGLSPTGIPLGPGSHYILGTDTLGRNMVPRLAYGARTSLFVAFVSNLTSIAVGGSLGLVAGFYRGAAEQVVMRVTDMGLALPYVLAALVLATVLPSGITRVIVIITALFWAYPARLVYGEVLRLRGRGFVEASVAAGAGGGSTIRSHLVPHLLPMLITYSPLNAASAIFFEATLSYLGAGVNPPTPSWGNMISEGQSAISIAPHLLYEPGLMLLVTTAAFLLIGEGLKVLNPDLSRLSWLGV
jgi:ABC-type dipeptide/oligopeptide/nickel transport system permease subunit